MCKKTKRCIYFFAFAVLFIIVFTVILYIAGFSAINVKQLIINDTVNTPYIYDSEHNKTSLAFPKNKTVKDFFAQSSDRYIFTSSETDDSDELSLDIYENKQFRTVYVFHNDTKISDLVLLDNKIYYTTKSDSGKFSLFQIDTATSENCLILSELDNGELFSNDSAVFFVTNSELCKYENDSVSVIESDNKAEYFAGCNNTVYVTYHQTLFFFYVIKTYDISDGKLRSFCLSSQHIDNCTVSSNNRYIVACSHEPESKTPLVPYLLDLKTGFRKQCDFLSDDYEHIIGLYSLKTE